MRKYIFLFLAIISLNIKGQSLDTVFTSTETIPCSITFINENNVFYSFKVRRTEKSAYKPLTEVKRIVLSVNTTASISISDTALANCIKRGAELAIAVKQISGSKTKKLQQTDSVRSITHADINNLNLMYNDIYNIQANLFKCHQEYEIGTGLLIGGYSLVLAGALIAISSTSNNETELGTLGIIFGAVGGIVSFAGLIVQIDSHKFIKRASISASASGARLIIKF